ncbi:MAG: molybdate transporter substrate-binding protein [Pseudomonadota bacterium]
MRPLRLPGHPFLRRWPLSFMLLAACAGLHAEAVQVAVAANFAGPMTAITAVFEKDTGHKALLSFGATGKFYAQIKSGAPFDVFLAADEKTPLRLADEGLAVASTSFTYATGRLVLWSARPDFVDAQGQVLKTGRFDRLAIAAPTLAPYGAAALETLTQLGLQNALGAKIVQGESIGQTFNFVYSGNAELGFVALSQVIEHGQGSSGSKWVVPASLYSPLHQDAVVLVHGKKNRAAEALMAFLKTEKARAIIRAFGYEL